MAVDLNREIRRAVDTGEVVFGEKQVEKTLKKGEGEVVILTNNAPKKAELKQLALLSGKKIVEFSGKGLELGSVCGKPFVVSVMLVKKAGKSNILNTQVM